MPGEMPEQMSERVSSVGTSLRCLLQSQSVNPPPSKRTRPFGTGVLGCGPDKLQAGSMSLPACACFDRVFCLAYFHMLT